METYQSQLILPVITRHREQLRIVVERKRGDHRVQVPQGLEGLRFVGSGAKSLTCPIDIDITGRRTKRNDQSYAM